MTDDSITPEIPKRHKSMLPRVLLIIGLVLVLTFAVLAVVFRHTLSFIFHPERIVINPLSVTSGKLLTLQDNGDIIDLEQYRIDGKDIITFTSKDRSISIFSQYDGEELYFIKGEINVGQVQAETVKEATSLANVLLSPFIGKDEIAAIVFKFSPDIIANAGDDTINMALKIGNGYNVTIEGETYYFVTFVLSKDED